MSVGKINPIGNVNRDTPLATERTNAAPEQKRNPRVMEAAQMYERHFLQEMVKAMRSTVQESELNSGGIGNKIYKDQLDEQYVDSWTEQGGIGLANMIYDEMMDKVLNANHGNSGFKEKPGPIALTDRDVSRVVKVPTQIPNQQAVRVELKPADGKTGPAQIQAPFDGKVLATTNVDGKATVLLEHAGGARSALIFDGVPKALTPGQIIKRGATVGLLSPEIRSFLWNVKAGPAKQDSAKISGPEDAGL